MLKLFCIDSVWIPVEGRAETIGEGELLCILSGMSGPVYFKIQPRAGDCANRTGFNFKPCFPATKWLKKNDIPLEIVTPANKSGRRSATLDTP